MSGSSNFLQWNPGAANQENDAQYVADGLRASGASNDAIFPAVSANKLFYQVSTMVAALAQAMADKGYTVSDANLNSLATTLSNLVSAEEFGASFGTSGYQKLPNGLILQWTTGYTEAADSSENAQTIAWPIAFPTACVHVQVSTAIGYATSRMDDWYQLVDCSVSGATVQRQHGGASYAEVTTSTPYVFGIGY